MIDKQSVLWWNEIQADICNVDDKTFGVELDLFNNHMNFYIRFPDCSEHFIHTHDVYEAIDEFNRISATLFDVLKSLGPRDELIEKVTIVYRTYGPNGEDLFAGQCLWDWKNDKLISLDGDDYSFEDPIIKHEVIYNGDKTITVTVWYESNWKCG